MDNFYMFISSKDSLDFYPSNAQEKFTINLPKFYNLTGDWVCGLSEIQYLNSFDDEFGLRDMPSKIYITCNIIDGSYVKNSEISILRGIHGNINKNELCTHTFGNIFYFKIIVKNFNTISFTLRDDTLQQLNFNNGELTATLHFKKWL